MQSHLRPPWEGSASSLAWLLAAFSFWSAVELGLFFLLAASLRLPQVSCHEKSLYNQFTTWQSALSKPVRERVFLQDCYLNHM